MITPVWTNWVQLHTTNSEQVCLLYRTWIFKVKSFIWFFGLINIIKLDSQVHIVMVIKHFSYYNNILRSLDSDTFSSVGVSLCHGHIGQNQYSGIWQIFWYWFEDQTFTATNRQFESGLMNCSKLAKHFWCVVFTTFNNFIPIFR